VGAAQAALSAASQPASSTPPPTPTLYQSLVDTGASNTCISPAVAKALGLAPVGMRPMGSATHQSVPTNIYIVDLALPLGAGPVWWFGTLQVFEFAPPPNSPYEMLLGRDILCQGNLTISFDGHFAFSI
jgi:gag-polyprotein putative aspartyl protease